jgi:hypothetical protein
MKAKHFRKPLLFLFAFLLSGVLSDVIGQPRLRFKTNRVLRKTAVVLVAAHHQLKTNRHFTGNFARAIAHQRFAKRQYVQGNFRRAIHHSRRARMLALTVIRDNKGTPKKEWDFASDENAPGGKDTKDNPTDTQLDQELIKDNPNQTFNDEDLVDKILDDVDVEDIVDNK